MVVYVPITLAITRAHVQSVSARRTAPPKTDWDKTLRWCTVHAKMIQIGEVATMGPYHAHRFWDFLFVISTRTTALASQRSTHAQ